MTLLRPFTFLSVAVFAAAPAFAQTPPNGECTGASTDPTCGAPNQSGGGCGCGCGCSILINFTDQGDSYQYADDFDDDTREDNSDNCPFSFNPDQVDTDGDLRGDACDNCASASNFDLRDSDADGIGDLCDDDADNDLVLNNVDDCVTIPNPGQADLDIDGFGNACDDNDDGDNCVDSVDKCPLSSEANCATVTALERNACFPDEDADQVEDVFDNCPTIPNVGNADSDRDGFGDACDADLDNDGIDNTFDNCRLVPNAVQGNEDKDSLGDACDPFRCFVVTDDASCLDPSAPFAVHSGKPMEIVTTDDPVLLHVFANRENTAIRYTWQVVEAPAGADSAWTITNPKGSVGFSRSIEYIYDVGHEAKFATKVPGVYKLKLIGELAFTDPAYPEQKVSESEMTISVGGDEIATACGAVPGSSAAAGALLGLLAVVRRKKRAA